MSNSAPRTGLIAQVVERVGLDELNVGDAIASAVVGGALERACRYVECDHGVGSARQVERERTVVAEAIECASASALADQDAILALVEERTSLLPVMRCGEEADAVFVHLDLVGYRATQELDADWQALLGTERDVIARENPGRLEQFVEHVDDDVAKRLESGAHELHDEPTIVPIADERGACVALAMHEAVRVRDAGKRCAQRDGVADARAPPPMVEHSVRIVVDHAQGDLRRRAPESDADRFPALVVHADCASGSGWSLYDVAAKDPRMSALPATRAFGGHDGDVGSGRRDAVGLNSGVRSNNLLALSHVIVFLCCA